MELAPNKNNNGDAGEEGRVAGEGKLGAPPDTAVPMHLPTKGGGKRHWGGRRLGGKRGLAYFGWTGAGRRVCLML